MTSRLSNARVFLLLVAITLLPIVRLTATAEEEEATPYYGDWENTHGDTLQITSDGIQVNDEKPVRYDDITEDSDGSFFVLQIKEQSESSYFQGKFLRITFSKDPDRFTMSIYKTLADALKQENEIKHVEWTAQTEEDDDDADE